MERTADSAVTTAPAVAAAPPTAVYGKTGPCGLSPLQCKSLFSSVEQKLGTKKPNIIICDYKQNSAHIRFHRFTRKGKEKF